PADRISSGVKPSPDAARIAFALNSTTLPGPLRSCRAAASAHECPVLLLARAVDAFSTDAPSIGPQLASRGATAPAEASLLRWLQSLSVPPAIRRRHHLAAA